MKKVGLCVIGAVVALLASFHFGLDHIASLGERMAGLSLADWALVSGIGLLVVSMVLYRIFVGPPVLSEEEEKEFEKEQKELDEWRRRQDLEQLGNPSIPGSGAYLDPFDPSKWW